MFLVELSYMSSDLLVDFLTISKDSGSKTIILHKEGINQGDFTII